MARRVRKEARLAPAPHNDVYTGLLAISCLAMLIGCAFLLLDWSRYPSSKPNPVSLASRNR